MADIKLEWPFAKQETCYIITRFIIDNLSQFKNGQVVNARMPQ